MPTDLEIREFLLRLAKCGPEDDVTDFLASAPQWLDQRVLVDVARFVTTHAEVLPLLGRVQAVQEIVRALETAATVCTLSDLADAAGEHDWLLRSAFGRLVDALVANLPSFAARLSNYLHVHHELRGRMEVLGQIHRVAGTANQITNNDMAIIDYLSVLKRLCGRRGQLETAQSGLQTCELLETALYNSLLTQINTSGVGTLRVFTSGRAQLWFSSTLVNPSLLLEFAVSVRSGALGFLQAVNLVAHQASRERENRIAAMSNREPVASALGRPEAMMQATTAFAVVAAIVAATPHQVAESLLCFHAAVGGSWWQSASAALRAETALHLAQFVLQRKALLADPQRELANASRLLTETLSGLDPSPTSTPGLRRDVNLFLARTLRERAVWAPDLVADAIGAFRRGLSVPWARHDCEARGLGLCDLAGAMRAQPRNLQPSESDIGQLYADSLLYLPVERFPRSRVTTLINFGIFLNERVSGNHADNQERALQLLKEAQEICQDNPVEDDAVSEIYFREQTASVFLTIGNVIRARRYGAPPQVVVAFPAVDESPDPFCSRAISAYREGLRVLRPNGPVALRGLFHLNIGWSHLEADSTPAASTVALREIDRALECFEGLPALTAVARVAQNDAWMRATIIRPDPREITRRIGEMGDNASACQNHGLLVDGGKALIQRARLRSWAGTSGAHLQGMADDFAAATQLFLTSGQSPRAVETLVALARVLVRRAESVSAPDGKAGMFADARDALVRAYFLVEQAVGRRQPLRHRIAQVAQLTVIASDLVWVSAAVGGDATELDEALERLGAPEADTPRHLQGLFRTDDIRAIGGDDALAAERDLWNVSGSTQLDDDVCDALDRLQSAYGDADLGAAMRWLERGEELHQEQGAVPDLLENDVVIQVVTSHWGAMAVVTEGPGAGHRTFVHLPFTRHVVQEWLQGGASRQGWAVVNRVGPNPQSGNGVWRNELSNLLLDLFEKFWAPILSQLPALFDGRRMLVAPGPLATLPLHAAVVDGIPVILRVRSWGYLAQGMNQVLDFPKQELLKAAIVVSVPVSNRLSQLPSAGTEGTRLANILSAAGVQVEVLVGRNGLVGSQAFDDPTGLASTVCVGTMPPSADRSAGLMETANLFVFVGHGLGETPVAGSLVTVEDSGRPGSLSMYDAIPHVLRNSNIGVILSACETAWDPDASSGGTTSISAALLRAGAKFVLGTQWWVADRVAPVVTEAFTGALLAGEPPERAFVIAAKTAADTQIDPLLWGTFCLWLGQGRS